MLEWGDSLVPWKVAQEPEANSQSIMNMLKKILHTVNKIHGSGMGESLDTASSDTMAGSSASDPLASSGSDPIANQNALPAPNQDKPAFVPNNN